MIGTEKPGRRPPTEKGCSGARGIIKLEQTRKKVAQSIPQAPPRQAARAWGAREGQGCAVSRISLPPLPRFSLTLRESTWEEESPGPGGGGEKNISPRGGMRIETGRLKKPRIHPPSSGEWARGKYSRKHQSRVCRRKNRVCPARSFTFLIIRVDTTLFLPEVYSTVRE